MMINKETVPSHFYKGDEKKPSAFTVGELMELLETLPPDLEIAMGFGDGVELCVYNIKTKPILEFHEIDY
jgi:hypothetical protein